MEVHISLRLLGWAAGHTYCHSQAYRSATRMSTTASAVLVKKSEQHLSKTSVEKVQLCDRNLPIDWASVRLAALSRG